MGTELLQDWIVQSESKNKMLVFAVHYISDVGSGTSI